MSNCAAHHFAVQLRPSRVKRNNSQLSIEVLPKGLGTGGTGTSQKKIFDRCILIEE